MMGKKPVTVYLEWPERDLLSLAPLVKLVWTSLISEMIDIYDNSDPDKCRPVLFLLDEAARIGLSKLDEYSSTVVGRKIILWMAFQSKAQADAIYGRDRAEVLRDNCDTQIFYRPANLGTAEFLERRLGRKSGWALGRWLSQNRISKSSSRILTCAMSFERRIGLTPDFPSRPPFRAYSVIFDG